MGIDDQRPAAKVPPEGGSIDSGPRFRLLVERSPDVFYRIRLTPEPVLEYVSPAAETVTGYTPAEFLSDPTLWEEVVHPDDRALIPDGESLAAATAEELEAAVVLRWITVTVRSAGLSTEAPRSSRKTALWSRWRASPAT